MEDADFETLQRQYAMNRKLEMLVESRQWTGKNGSEWRMDPDFNRPFYFGVHGKSRIYASDDATGYDVITYDFRGNELKRSFVKGTETALKRGVKQADES